jgi:integrase/recombinase XerD
MGSSPRFPVVSGPLAPFAAGFGSWLTARGYSPWTVGHRLEQFDQISRWLGDGGLGVEELSSERADRFLGARRAAGYVTFVSSRSLALPLEYLREVGVAPIPAPAVEGPLDELLDAYCRYLVGERGLASSTIPEYVRVARWFLSDRMGAGGLALEQLSAADVSGFLARECPRVTVAGARNLVGRLRPLLRYLHVAGLIGVPLQWVVPGVAHQRDRSLPRGLAPAVVKRLLASCDRRRTVGRRDYAILLLLLRLGLRAGEVAAIELDDVDWRRGEIMVRGKRNRCDQLPLPVDVGEALAAYLSRRPRDESRALFLKVHAPAGAVSGDVVRGVVKDACVRASLPRVGAHRLRHTAATGMLREGASLREIAQVLRHHEIATTAIYAKVDRARLRALAQPWPGGAS